ncbi:hypothetical protein [Streptomyces sp. SLBN-134]|uniref:hypothetical protein n=1 Tax=Streptomyces sp. SLBN-134 TaxID=2768456 RepID=UPI001152086B|nr:hypothetical protein [Streptomyces sp. SLBN-134]TQL20044.1 hypothetical protein FBY37_1990 [Streptomyces sp. SLBN-134]
MAGNYSADIQAILQSSRHLADAVRYGDEMLPRFETGNAAYAGWWGEEGGDDDFANSVGPQVRQEQEQVAATVTAITSGFMALVDAVAAEADHVQRPQNQALEDIEAHGSESGTRR